MPVRQTRECRRLCMHTTYMQLASVLTINLGRTPMRAGRLLQITSLLSMMPPSQTYKTLLGSTMSKHDMLVSATSMGLGLCSDSAAIHYNKT